MASKCKITKSSIESIVSNDQDKKDEFENTTKFVDVNESLVADLKNEFPDGTLLDENQIDDFLNKHYGAKDERGKIVSKIYGLLSGTTIVHEMFEEYVFEHLPAGVKLTDEKRNIDLRKFPIASLKLYYNFLFDLARQTNPRGKAYTNFGGIISALRTPKRLARKEPTGAYFNISKATREYPKHISSRINQFMRSTKIMKDIAKQLKMEVPRMSMEQIYGEIEFLVSKEGDPKKNQDLFHRYMMGWIYFDEKDNFMVYQDYAPLKDENGYILTHENGDVKFGFSNPIALKNYESKDLGIKKGDWNVEFKGEGLAKFKKFTEEARKIDNLTFEYSKRIMNKSLDTLLGELTKSFKSLTEPQIKEIFFRSDGKKAKEIIKSFISKEDLELYKTFKDIFATTISDELIIANGGRIDNIGGGPGYKTNHFPVLYDNNVYLPMLEKMITEFEGRMRELKDIIEDKSEDMDIRREAGKMFRNYRAKLNNASNIRDNFDGYHQDVLNDTLINFAKDSKYFKRISNAYDIRSAKTDSAVYYDYLKHIFGAAERNTLAAKLVESIRISKSDVVNRTSINMFKIPFADPSIEGLFGISIKDMADKTGLDAEKIERHLRKWSSWLTGAYLGSFTTPFTNVSAIIQNYLDYGASETKIAMKLLKNKAISERIQEIIAQSGITEYSDFFSRSMVNGVLGVQLEQDIAYHSIGAMLQYHSRIKKGMSESKSRQIFEEYMSPILAQSKVWMSAADLYIPEKERLKMRGKELRSAKIQTGLNKFIQFSIEREYEFKHVLDNVPIGKMTQVKEGAKNFTISVGMAVSTVLKKMGLTMSDTEAYVRTLSFIIGANIAWKGGMLNQDVNWWEYTDPADIAEVISIGSLLSEFTNFGLSSQSVGRIGHGAVGKLFVKFKNWSMQKAGTDVKILHNAYIETKELAKIERRHPGLFKTWSPKAIVKTMGSLFYNPWGKKAKDFRTVAPAKARLRAFFWGQGFLTFLWDVFVAGPIKIPFLTKYMYSGILGKTTRNFSSDLLSLMMLPITIAARLMIPGPFDEDEAERTINYYMRRTMLGYVPMAMWDLMVAAYALARGDIKQTVKKVPIPAPPALVTPVKQLLESTVAKKKKYGGRR